VETSLYVNNLLFISSLLSHFIEKKYFHRNVGTYKIGGAPSTQHPRVFTLVEILQNTHRNIKGVVYAMGHGKQICKRQDIS